MLKQYCTYSAEVKERNQEEWAKESGILMIKNARMIFHILSQQSLQARQQGKHGQRDKRKRVQRENIQNSIEWNLSFMQVGTIVPLDLLYKYHLTPTINLKSNSSLLSSIS